MLQNVPILVALFLWENWPFVQVWGYTVNFSLNLYENKSLTRSSLYFNPSLLHRWNEPFSLFSFERLSWGAIFICVTHLGHLPYLVNQSFFFCPCEFFAYSWYVLWSASYPWCSFLISFQTVSTFCWKLYLYFLELSVGLLVVLTFLCTQSWLCWIPDLLCRLIFIYIVVYQLVKRWLGHNHLINLII